MNTSLKIRVSILLVNVLIRMLVSNSADGIRTICALNQNTAIETAWAEVLACGGATTTKIRYRK